MQALIAKGGIEMVGSTALTIEMSTFPINSGNQHGLAIEKLRIGLDGTFKSHTIKMMVLEK